MNDKNHKIIDYELKNNIWNEHGERYIFYCIKCNKNLCDLCDFDNHDCKIITNIIKKNNIQELRIKIDKLKNKIKDASNNSNIIIDNFEIYYNLINNIINNYDKKYNNL